MSTAFILEAEENQIAAYPEPHQDSVRPMITALHVENFRCFQRIDLKDLGRFNIVVGSNGSGKTALLESIVLPAGRQDLVFRLRTHRGLTQAIGVTQGFPNQTLAPSQVIYESFWKDLFYKFDQNDKITIAIEGTRENTRKLCIFYNPKTEAQIRLEFQSDDAGQESQKAEQSAFIPLTFETTVNDKTYTNIVTWESNKTAGLTITGDNPPPAVIMFLPTIGSFSLQQQFSMLDVKKQKEGLIQALREVFPIIQDISIQWPAPQKLIQAL